MSGPQYSLVRPAVVESSLAALAPYMFWLMFRNVASDGLVFQDPEHAGVLSQPGCVLASPSWENSATQVTQDYVYNWTRDAAVVAIERWGLNLSQGCAVRASALVAPGRRSGTS